MSGGGNEQSQIPIDMENGTPQSNQNSRSSNGDFKSFDINLIPKILNFIKADRKFGSLIKIKFPHQQTESAIEFSEMERKTYKSVEHFEDDIKSFVRHCRSFYPHNQELHDASNELIENVKEQIQTMNTCIACYGNLHDFYTSGSVQNQCTNRHLLLWAKAQDYDGYWPAKVLAVNAEEGTFRIQYFGDYSCFSLPLENNNCYLYSSERPDKKSGARIKICSKALKDVAEYIRRFKNFKYAKRHTMFQPEKLNDYLNNMIAENQSTDDDETSDDDDDDDDKSSESETNSTSNYSPTDAEFGGWKVNRRCMRKRNANRSASNGIRVKRNRIESDTDEADDENAMESIRNIERDTQHVKQTIENLQNNLKKMTNEKKVLERKTAALTGKKDALVEKIASLNDAQCNEKRKWDEEKRKIDDDKNKFERKITELEESRRKDKEMFDREKMELQQENGKLKTQFDDEKKAFEEEKKTLMEKNAQLEKEISKEKEEYDDKKRAWDKSFEDFKENSLKLWKRE